jgi:hypothetical protein
MLALTRWPMRVLTSVIEIATLAVLHAREHLALRRDGVTLVAEAAFRHKLWVPKLQPLQDIAQIRLIVCSIDPLLAQTRFIQRGLSDPEREGYHGSGLIQPHKEDTARAISTYEPPRLAVPSLTVDTSDGYKPSLEQMREFALQPTEKDNTESSL